MRINSNSHRIAAPVLIRIFVTLGLVASLLIPIFEFNTHIANATVTVGSGNCIQNVNSLSGVTVMEIGNDCVVTFVSANTWTAPVGISTARVLVVGGGGGGDRGLCAARWGHGGGGGQVKDQSASITSLNSYTVTVGAGGNGDTPNTCNTNVHTVGGDSAFGSITSGGGQIAVNASAVGGVSGGNLFAGGTGTGLYGAGGGGGAGGAGGSVVDDRGLTGGVGVNSDISGSTYMYGSGGAGKDNVGNGTASSGGGSYNIRPIANRGGGGSDYSDGTYWNSQGGAAGVVIVRYTTTSLTATASNQSATYTGSPVTVTNSISLTGSLAAGDSISSATYTYAGINGTTYSSSTTAPTTVGSYSITPSAAVFALGSINAYKITYMAGTLTISNATCNPISDTSTVGGFTILKFTSTGTCNWVTPTGVAKADYLLIGGGGSGGPGIGGGGGGGEYIERTNQDVSGTIIVTVGAGGTSANDRAGGNGNNSVFGSVTAFGGGGGGGGGGANGLGSYFAPNSGNIGSGGGGHYASASGATKSAGGSGRSNNGGAGSVLACASATAGGGGGAGAVGGTGTSTFGGNGGDGFASSITGSTVYYAAGGGAGINGGAGCVTTGNAGNAGSGGNGGGGNGGLTSQTSPSTNNGFAAISNSGSGGGGGSNINNSSVNAIGGAGGSGLLVIKYVNTFTVTYNYNGADAGNGTANNSFSLGGSAITLPTPTKTGFVFGGWYSDSGLTTSVSSPFTPTGTNATITIYAKWNAPSGITNAPNPPTSVVANGEGGGVKLTWAAPVAKVGVTITGYQVEHSTTGAPGSWTVASNAIASNATTYQITGLTSGTSYYTRIAATYSGGLGAYGYPWKKIYYTTTPTRNSSNEIVYVSGYGLAVNDAWSTVSSFTRIRYLMKATFKSTSGGAATPYYVDSDFVKGINTPSTSNTSNLDTASNLRVPSLSGTNSQFVTQGDVYDLTVISNVTAGDYNSAVTNGYGFNGRVELWGTNYTATKATGLSTTSRSSNTNSIYDDNDLPTAGDTTGGFGSFQLHNITSGSTNYEQTIFSWSRHIYNGTGEIGFGSSNGSQSDWTICSNTNDCSGSIYGRSNFSLEIFVNVPIVAASNKYVFSANTGSGAQADLSFVGSQLVAPSVTFTAPTGYSFVGWCSANPVSVSASCSSVSGTQYLAGANLPTPASTSVTLYAVWTPNSNTITFNANDGSGTPSTSTQTISSGTATALTANSFTRAGYTFAGWDTQANGLGTDYSNQQSVTITSGLTLYAQWTANTLNITWNSNGGTSVTGTTTTTGGSISSAPTAPTKSGYTLSGWSATDGGSIVSFSYSHDQTGNFTMYAVWSANTNNAITWNNQSATTVQAGGSSTYTTGLAISNIPTTAPLLTGSTFMGWYTASSGGTKVTDGSYTPASPYGSVTLYAQWITTCTVTGSTSLALGYTVYKFINTGTCAWTVPSGITTAEILVVGGGGAGGSRAGGGGGAGGYKTVTSQGLTAGDIHVIKVGAGGAGQAYGTSAINGEDSYFGNLISVLGGGGGGGAAGSTGSDTGLRAGKTGGSGGGAATNSAGNGSATIGSGTAGQGNNGGSGAGVTLYPGGGGGGAGDDGGNSNGSTGTGGKGGTGISNSITGSAVCYATGGGGGVAAGKTPGAGGDCDNSGTSPNGGAGLSTQATPSVAPNITVANTGAGGAGNGWTNSMVDQPGGSGASGIVVVRFVNTYSVTYSYDNATGGNSTTNSTYTTGGSTIILPTPTKTGFSFGGWYKESGLTTSIGAGGASYSPNDSTLSLTIYAKWISNNYAITVTQGSNGTISPSTGDQSYGSTPTYTFTPDAGYSLASVTVDGSALSAGDVTTAATSGYTFSSIAATHTITATYSANTLTITYDSKGGTSVTSGSTTTGGSISAAPTAPTKAGYSLSGWSATEGGSTVSFPFTHGKTSSFTMHAIWAANSLAITYDSKGGSPVTSGTTTTGGTISAAPTAPTKAGYTLSGWSATDGGSAVTFAYTHGKTADFTMYALWSANTLNITYDANGGTSVSGGDSTTTTGGTLSALPTATYTGYTLSGWFTASSSGTQITTSATHGQTANFTLYAQWTGNTNTITYDSKGGTSVANGSFITGGTIASAPTAPTRAGYSLTGWSATDGGSAISYPYSPVATSGITLYAIWTGVSCSPTSSVSGGYTIYTFTTAGTCFWSIPNGVTDVEILAVGGGGGGGYAWDNAGAGGGAGGQVKTGTATLSTTLEVAVGAGGSAGISSSTRGGTGTNTVVSTLTALGGTGGCSARATSCSNSAQATSSVAASGGAGGAGGASGKGGGGSSTTSSATTTTTGGAGIRSSYTGTSVTYGVGGAGGTARGLSSSTNIAGLSGSANTGNGGGGASAKSASGPVDGGAGGSGLVVIRVASALAITFDSQSGSSVSNGSTFTGASISSAPTQPTRSNYTFLGWFTATSGGSAISFPYAHGQTADFTLYAQWALNTYAIAFNANNGSGTMANQTITHGAATYLNSNLFTRANYVFYRWATAADGSGTTYNNGAQVTLTAGTTLYAQWTANTYVLTYNYDNATGGNSSATSSFTTGGSPIVLPTPTRTGYTFSGWYSDSALTSSIGSAGANYSPTGATLSLSAYAKWTPIDYSFTYDANQAGSGSVPTETSRQINQTATIKANTGSLVRDGYTFSGWNTQSNGGGTTYLSGAIFTVQSSDVTLYAKWDANTYTVTYNSNGGTGSAQRSSSNVSSDNYTTGGSAIALPDAGTLQRDGYTFGGWNTSASGGGTNRAAAASYTTVSNVTLYAKWNAITYVISYNGNTSDGGSAPTSGGYTTGQASPYSVASNTFTKSLHVFGGWNTASTGLGTSYSPSSSITTLSDIVLYAVWIPQYTLHYAINGGSVTSGSLPSDQLYNSGTSVGPVFSSVSRTGYNFGGWSNGATTISSGGSFTIVADSVLTAIWTPINYAISYESDGGSTAPSSTTKQIGQSYSVGASITKPGHNFAGWSNGTSVVGAGAGIVMGSSDVTYTAQWVAQVYTVSYDWNGGRGTAVNNVNYTFGTTAITLPLVGDRVKDGYTFAGWSESANGSALGSTYTPSQSRTLYALWNIGNFTVTYDAGRGTIATSTVAVQNGGSTTLPLPTRTNFVFNGWHTAVTGGSRLGANGDSFTPSSSQTVYARWIQSSLYGITDSLSRIGSVVTASNIANTFSGANSNSSVAVSVPANALPAGTTINFDLVSNSSRATGILTGVNYLVSIALSWLTGDEAVPDTASDKPISVTISNSTIKAGAAAYAIVNNVSTLLGTATQDGVITVQITSDPEIVVAATKSSAPTNVSATSNGNQQSVISWSAPTSDGGSAITGYTVTANTGATCTSSGTSCTISSLTNGTSYTFTVTATNGVGTSVASASASATTASLYTVAFDSKGGSLVTNGSFLTASTVSEPTAPTRDGYAFAGWSATDGGAVETFPYAPGVTSNVTMFARWDALDHAVSFDAKGGSAVIPSTFASGATVSEPTAPTKSGYTFVGWSATDGGNVITFPYSPGVIVDITLYAKWSAVSQSNNSGGSSSGGSSSGGSSGSSGNVSTTSAAPQGIPVTTVGDSNAKVEVTANGKITSASIPTTSSKYVSKVEVIDGKLSLTPATGFSGKQSVVVETVVDGAVVNVQVALTVLPEPVTATAATPKTLTTAGISWDKSPNASKYDVYLNGKKICSTSSDSCNFNSLVGPKDKVEIVALGGDQTKSEKVRVDYAPEKPVLVNRIVGSTRIKTTLTATDKSALNKVIALIKKHGFTTVSLSQVTTTSATKAAADKRIDAIQAYIQSGVGKVDLNFVVTKPTSRTVINNVSLK